VEVGALLKTEARLTRVLVVSWLAAAALVASAPAGSAQAAATVEIVAPAEGSSHAAPFGGPLTVRFTGVDGSESLGLGITGPDGYGWSATVTPTADGTQDFPFTAATNAGAYTAVVSDVSGAELATATFTVTKPNAATIAPEPGSELPPGFEGELAVSWTSISNVGHSYRVELAHAGATVVSCAFAGLGLEGTTTTCPTGVLGPGSYTAAAIDGTTGERFATSTFRVLAPPPAPRVRIVAQAVSRRSFYPLRRDGFRDKVTFSFLTNLSAAVTVSVRTPSGKVVRRKSLGTLAGGERHSWKWGGRNDRGKLVDTGRYRVRIRARRGDQRVKGRGVEVRVRTGFAVRRAVQARYGRGYSSLDQSASCAHRIHEKGLYLACVGRASATARYVFAVPKRAFRIRGYRGHAVYGVYVGSPRRIFVRRERTSPRRYVVETGISQRRGRTGIGVLVVAISYRYRMRI
jgi:hypothetical protein